MNYQKIYDNLMKKGLGRSKTKTTYYESHHIVPRCIGGSDEACNLVLLTPEEHYLAHQLLVKIHPNYGRLIHAAVMMSTGLSARNNKCYGWLRKRLSHRMTVNNPNKGGVARKAYIEKYGVPKADTRNKPETYAKLSQRMKENNPVFRIERLHNAIYILKIDPNTNEVVYKYNTLTEARKSESLTVTIFKKLDSGEVYKGFIWKRSKV